MTDHENARPAGGRPRDPRIEDAILEAARTRLVTDGYSRMSLADIASDAGSSKPALYRRWAGKHDLVVDALRYGYERERDHVTAAPHGSTPFDRFRAAVEQLDPQVVNANAVVLQGGILAESARNPQLLEALQEHGVGPRCELFTGVLAELQEEGAIRADVDVDALTTMVFGSYFGRFLRYGQGDSRAFAETVAEFVWPLIRAGRDRADGG